MKNNFHALPKMAKDILAIMATSVPVERMFSEAGLIFSKKRSSLEDDSARALLCTNMWMKSSLKKEVCE